MAIDLCNKHHVYVKIVLCSFWEQLEHNNNLKLVENPADGTEQIAYVWIRPCHMLHTLFFSFDYVLMLLCAVTSYGDIALRGGGESGL